MRTTKRDAIKKEEIIAQAKEIHAHFIAMVKGNLKKYGMEAVAQSYMNLQGPVGPYWLRRALERVLDFAEKAQIKELDKPLVDQSTHATTHVTVEIQNENKTPQESGNRISEYLEV